MSVPTSVLLEKQKENYMTFRAKKVALRCKDLTLLFCNKNTAWTNFSHLFHLVYKHVPVNNNNTNSHVNKE